MVSIEAVLKLLRAEYPGIKLSILAGLNPATPTLIMDWPDGITQTHMLMLDLDVERLTAAELVDNIVTAIEAD